MENENWGEDIISLMDEEGNQSEYKIVACAEMDGTEYMALLCASAPYDMIQHFSFGSRISVWPDCRPPIRRMEEGSVKAREATHLVA